MEQIKVRGTHFSCVSEFDLSDTEKFKLMAVGHMDKKPMLLVASTGTTLPAEPRVKQWQTVNPDGTVENHVRETPQPNVHYLYR